MLGQLKLIDTTPNLLEEGLLRWLQEEHGEKIFSKVRKLKPEILGKIVDGGAGEREPLLKDEHTSREYCIYRTSMDRVREIPARHDDRSGASFLREHAYRAMIGAMVDVLRLKRGFTLGRP